ncbi:MAG: ankyrin repeat domain-containing protein [Chloroflexi bacterium]|nr:ankyrin repeat domain-containing protein [Chloroflexota bacterium]
MEVRDEYGRTPLHLAALGNSPDIARLLIDSGADIEGKDNGGGTALHFAARNNSLDVATLLIDSGADIVI